MAIGLTDDFFENLADDDHEAAYQIAQSFFDFDESVPRDQEEEYIAKYLEYASAIQALRAVRGVELGEMVIEKIPQDTIKGLRDYFLKAKENSEGKFIFDSVSKGTDRFKKLIESKFRYEFTDGDLTKIQGLLDDLRQQISISSDLESSHKQRILKRLERLQQELHKKMSDLDGFWGLVGDAGVMLGKLGNDAKPIVDRIKDIADIVWRTQSTAEELPTDSPLPRLENSD